MHMSESRQRPPHFIREWRKHRGLTLEQLAERIGMTHQNLGKVERFKVPYSQTVLERLADALRTDPASLIMRDPADPEGLWSIWDELTPPERRTAAGVLRVIRGSRAAREE
jgi:transcriptional regulator with XRE-family HTH domain